MQEIIHSNRRYHVITGYNAELIANVLKNCGSEATKATLNYVRAVKFYSGKNFYSISCENKGILIGNYTKTHFRLAELAVVKEEQGKGMGTALLNKLKADCIKRRILKITLRTSRNEDAYKWYQIQGGQITGVNGSDYEMEISL
jgi:GNAT superfamily N-acetyltransferase